MRCVGRVDEVIETVLSYILHIASYSASMGARRIRQKAAVL